MNTNQLANTAHHEAAHVIVANRLQVKIEEATIVPGRDSLGHIRTNASRLVTKGVFKENVANINRTERDIVVCYAGPIASRKHSPRSRWRAGGVNDFKSASLLMSFIGGSDDRYYDLYRKLLWRRAECLVEGNWKAIQHLATVLLERKSLSPREIDAEILNSYGIESLDLSKPAAG
jgi:hypothetical protein